MSKQDFDSGHYVNAAVGAWLSFLPLFMVLLPCASPDCWASVHSARIGQPISGTLSDHTTLEDAPLLGGVVTTSVPDE
ncbi:hypothetical protein [Nonomuraea zeae]|uniref:Uncharacterized protein n=1 Tax=Nonomuraea zeae TaxID=1642303 RepID=A0A5S4G4W5_9ACTN|nr:hypothetical protein [Nonomuraea zeae]TMR28043.1 hypothetical protein ETD85_37120 [Nonomuraea zeae]